MSPPTVIVAEPDSGVRAALALVAAARGWTFEAVATGAGLVAASRRVEAQLLVAAVELPDGDGARWLASARRARPGPALLLSDAPAQLSRSAPERLRLSHVLLRRGTWGPSLGALLDGLVTVAGAPPPGLLEAAHDPMALGALAPSLGELGGLESAVLAVLASGPESAWAPVLAAAADAHGPCGRLALRAAGLGVAGPWARIAGSDGLPLELRVAAIGALARPPADRAALETLRAAIVDASPFVRHAAARAALELGRAASPPLVDWLLSGARVPLDVRLGAAEAIRRRLGSAEIASRLAALGDAAADRLRARLHDGAASTAEAADAARSEALDRSRPRAVRLAAVGRLDGRPESERIELAIALASDPDPAVAAAVVARAAAEPEPAVLDALQSEACPPPVRAMVAALGPGRPEAARRRAAAARDPDPRVRATALLVTAPVPGPELEASLLEAAEDPAPHTRLQVVALADRSGAGGAALERLAGDSEPGLAAAALEVLARRAGAEVLGLLPLVTRAPELGHALVAGVARLGEAGYGALVALALAGELPDSARLEAARLLREGWPETDVRAVVERLRHVLRPRAQEAITEPSPRARGSRPRRPGRDRAPRGPSRTAPTRPATPAPLPPTEPASPADLADRLPTEASPPAPPPFPTAPVEPARPVLPPFPASLPPFPSAPSPRAASGPSPSGAHAVAGPAPAGARPGRDRGRGARADPSASTARPAGTARAPLRVAPRAEADARQRLLAAIKLGSDGFEPLRELVEAGTVPAELRVTALRQLVHGFEPKRTAPVLEHALLFGPPKLQHAALAASMSGGGAAAPLDRLARSPDQPADVRLRALRQLAAQHGKTSARDTAEALLDDADANLRRAALETLFPSMRHTQETAIEDALLGLLADHPSARVKLGAARALATYGGARSIRPLLELGLRLLTKPTLRGAAREAVQRIAARDPDARRSLEIALAETRSKL